MAELRPHYIDVDLKKNTQYNVPVVTQNDTATHFIIRVTDDGLSDPELLDAYQEITMTSQRPDGESFYLTGTRIPGTNEIEFHLGTDETAFSGSVLASLQFYLVEDASRYTSAQFRYDVKKDLTKNYTPTQREETLVEVVLRDGPGVIQEAREAKQAVDGALVDLEQDKTAAIDRLDEVTEENKTVFRQPVNTFADLATTYPNPEHGTTVRVTSEAASYRYSDGSWVKTDEYNPTAIDQVTAQLAETVEKSYEISSNMNKEILGRKERKTIMSFVDDDGRSEVRTKWESILTEKNVPLTVCLITSRVGNSGYLGWDDVEHLKGVGVEFVSHTHTHPELPYISEPEMVEEFETSNRILREHGCQPNVLVYPGGNNDATVRKVARRYYRASLAIGTAINYPPIETQRINRLNFAGTNNTWEYYKGKIDEAIENNGWIIWMSHAQFLEFDETQQQFVRDMIDYARSQGVEITNINDGLDLFGNVLDIGDYPNGNYTVIDNQGNLHSKDVNQFTVKEDTGIDFNTPLSAFGTGKVTRVAIQDPNKAGFPENKPGTLETSSLVSYLWTYQLYYPINTNSIYKRTWNNSTNSWNTFEMVSPPAPPTNLVTVVNSYSFDTPIADFPSDKITIFFVNGTGKAGFPNNKEGICTTYKIGGNVWYRQEYRPISSNEIWSRYVSSGAWTPFVKITAV